MSVIWICDRIKLYTNYFQTIDSDVDGLSIDGRVSFPHLF